MEREEEPTADELDDAPEGADEDLDNLDDDLDVSELDDEPDYNPDDEELKRLKGG